MKKPYQPRSSLLLRSRCYVRFRLCLFVRSRLCERGLMSKTRMGMRTGMGMRMDMMRRMGMGMGDGVVGLNEVGSSAADPITSTTSATH